MRAGMGAALVLGWLLLGAARPHHSYLIANQMRVLVQTGIGACAAEWHLNSGKLVWPHEEALPIELSFIVRFFDAGSATAPAFRRINGHMTPDNSMRRRV